MELTEALRALTRNERAFVLAALAVLVAACWAYLFGIAADMSDMAEMPGMSMLEPRLANWTASETVAMFVMWSVMMAAMMLPSAAPMILLHAALRARSGAGTIAHSGLFMLGYVAVWTGFSVIATGLQWALEQTALLSPMMVSESNALGGGLLVAAGIYQATQLKHRCLSRCRAPAAFLNANWKRGPGGAFRMGLAHGLYCLGCCWATMLLLFVGGVMNLLWIAGLSAFVLAEKVLPRGQDFARLSGAAMVLAGVWLMFS